MPLIYAFVARGTTVLAEYTPFSGNFVVVGMELLTKLQQSQNLENKLTVACDKHTFNFLIHNGYTYLVVADEAYGRQIPFAFLERVRDEFEDSYASKAVSAIAHSLDKTFGLRLKSHMEYCMAHPEEISKVAAVQKKVNEVKEVMVENIEKILQRGEKIELLVGKTDDLATHAETFQKKGRALRSKMWWQNLRMKLCVLGVLIVLGIVIFVLVCFSGGNCIKGNPSPAPAPAPAPVPVPVPVPSANPTAAPGGRRLLQLPAGLGKLHMR